jgi:hypothetical protein
VIGALIGATAVLAMCGILFVKDQFDAPERLAQVEGPAGEWYALYAEYPVGDYDPSWHVYRFANHEALAAAQVQRGFDKGALFETYEEGGDHDEDATLEVFDGRFLVLSKAGLFHSLYDIECNRLVINDESPFDAAWQAAGEIPHDSPSWARFYLQWKLDHLHRPIEAIIAAKARCGG